MGAEAEKGDNDANLNTGGDVTIDTGNATGDANVDNMVNFNSADVDCGCTWDVLAKIAGNGADKSESEKRDANIIKLGLNSTQTVGQGNNATLTNNLNDEELEADTGDNEASSNTGDPGGDPTVRTGDADVVANVSNSGNVNAVGDLLPFDWPDFPSDVDFSFNLGAFWALFGLSL